MDRWLPWKGWGKTRKEVARQLKVPEGTLSSRLTTARTMLAKRLARHGLVVSGGALATVLSQESASASVPTSAVSSTIKAASLLAAGNGAASITSVKVAALTEGVLKAMFVAKLKVAGAVLLAVSLIGIGMTVITYRTLASDQGGATDDAAPKAAAKGREKGAEDAERPRVDGADRGKNAGEEGKPEARGEEKQGKEEPLENRASDSSKLRELLKERMAAVQTLADSVKGLYKQGTVSEEAVRQAELRVHKTELDLCDSTKERIGVLEKIVKVYQEMEDHTLVLEKRGTASSESVLEAKLMRLEAQIAVEREKATLARSPK